MENEILKKKLSTYKSSKGYFKSVPDRLLLEILNAWEQWPGSKKEFYTSIGTTYRQMGSIMGKAKKLKREGAYFEEEEFVELSSMEANSNSGSTGLVDCQGIRLNWSGGQVIEFPGVDTLLEFLKKSA